MTPLDLDALEALAKSDADYPAGNDWPESPEDLADLDLRGYPETAAYLHVLRPNVIVELIAAARERDALRDAITVGRWREQDLRWCRKGDLCGVKAEGAALALADIDDHLVSLGLTPPAGARPGLLAESR